MVCARWSVTTGHYSWKEVHGPHFNEIDKIPVARGLITMEKWGQVISGYVAFFVFGTSTDAHNLHKKILLKLGLGKVFPSLFVTRESASEGSLLRRLVAARTWSSNLSSRAKSKFQSKASSFSSSINSSIYRASMRFDLSTTFHSVVTEKRTPTPSQDNTKQGPLAAMSSFFQRIFRRAKNHGPVLPLFSSRTPTESIDSSSTTKGSPSSSTRTQIRASNTTMSTQTIEPSSVRVMQEVHQNRHARERADSLPNYTYRWI